MTEEGSYAAVERLSASGRTRLRLTPENRLSEGPRRSAQ
jgi:hypothetical protein